MTEIREENCEDAGGKKKMGKKDKSSLNRKQLKMEAAKQAKEEKRRISFPGQEWRWPIFL